MGDAGEFGKAPTYKSDVAFDLAVSDDKKAFTATFDGLTIDLEPASTTHVVTRSFSFAIPLSGANPGEEIPFFVGGFAASEKDANVHLMFSVNDQTTIAYFPPGSNNDFTQRLNFKVGDASEVHITVFLWEDRDSKSNAEAHVSVLAIDTDILKH
jgi:hypothetical protein